MDNGKHNLNDLMGTTLSKIREMIDVNTIVGAPITTPDGATIIPVSKLSLGFASGGSDFGKDTKNFGGGGSGGVKISPVAFLIVTASGVKLLPTAPAASSPVERAIEMAPSLIEKVEAFLDSRKKKKKDEADEEADA